MMNPMQMQYPPAGFPVMNPNMMMGRPAFPAAHVALYIGNLDQTVHEEQLFSLFSRYGAIHSLKIVKDRNTGKSKGFGYINFTNAKDGENARMLLQYEKVGKNPIRLMYKKDPKSIQLSQGNIFVKNIDPSVSFKELHNFFTPAGNVLSVKIGTNKDGESLGYGYVQFEKEEDAKKAIEELNGKKLKEQELAISNFVPRNERDFGQKKNLYVKNLPEGKSKQEIENLLNTEFSKYGPIISQAAIQKDNKWSAFICYENAEDAQNALSNLSDKDVFGTGTPLYVNHHQSRQQRDQALKDDSLNVKNEKSIMLKNLKPETTDADIKSAFQVFGEVVSAIIKVNEVGGDKKHMAFVNFQEAEDATRALREGHGSEELKKYFVNEEPHINCLLTKAQREQFKQAKANLPFAKRTFNNNVPGVFNQGGAQGAYPGMMPPRMGYNNMPMMNQGFNQRGPRPYMQGGQPQMPMQQRQGGGMMRGRAPMGQNRNGPMGQNPQVQGGAGQNFQQRGPQQGRVGGGMGGPGGARSNYQQGGPGQNRGPRGNSGNQGDQPRDDSKEQKPKQNEPVQALTVHNLRTKLDDFLKLDAEKQRNILGELLYPKILGVAGPQHAPKITGMLVDFDVLTVQDILEMLEDDAILRERISEAEDLIKQEQEEQ